MLLCQTILHNPMKLDNFALFPPLDQANKRDFISRLQKDFPNIEIIPLENDHQVLKHISRIVSGYGWISPKALEKANKLVWLANPDSGSFVNESGKDGWFYKELIQHPVIVTNPKGIYSDYIGQHVMAYILALSQRLPDYMEVQKNGLWIPDARRHPSIRLCKSKIMIVGAGGIGQEIARLCKPFGLEITGVDPKPIKSKYFDKIIEPDKLINTAKTSDIIVTTVMHTPETHFMFDLNFFKNLKSNSIFINIGRGKTTVLNDLVYAIKNNLISGAGLDVFEEEPLPANHELWRTPGVIITPHVALMDSDEVITNRRYEILKQNIKLFQEDKPLHNIVDKEKWY